MPQPHNLAEPANDAAAPMTLSAIRAEIDRIDEALLALMEQRLAASLEVARLKQSDSAFLLLRPDREQQVIEGLCAKTDLPREMVGTVWRELMALSLQAQKKTEIVLHADQQPVLITDQMRRRFGCAAPVVVAGSAEEALQRARTRDAVAIIELGPLSHWWTALLGDPELIIFDCLRDAARISALAVGRLAPGSAPLGTRFPILDEQALRSRIDAGEAIRPIAMSGELRLCISEGATA